MSNNKSTPTAFIATVHGDLITLNNSALSKARLKIFYKGKNRNGSYITDDMAEKMLATLPGTPIVGYFDADKGDFLGHVSKETARAYGFVPDANNFEWETHLDNDGVYRTYACCDVILWTGRYPVASKIVGKNHSMELNPDTIDGVWVDYDDEYYFQFSNAEFLGLCVLGDEYEPCFEGSSFYELRNTNGTITDDLTEMFSLYKSAIDMSNENPTGGNTMDESMKDQKLDSNVAEPVVEETETAEATTEVEKEVEVEVSTEMEKEAEVEEAVEEETTEEEPVTEEEDCAADPVEKEKVEEEVVKEVEETETNNASETEENEEEKVEETVENTTEESGHDEDVENAEIATNAALIAAKDEEIASLKAQLEELKQYKAVKVKEEKENILETYSSKLTEEEVENFKSIMDNFENPIDFKKEIALCILDKEDTVATKETEDNTSAFALVQNQKEKLTGAEAIIAQYVNKK